MLIKLILLTHLTCECCNEININYYFKKLRVININNKINIDHKYYNYYSIDITDTAIKTNFMYLFSFNMFVYNNKNYYEKIYYDIKHMFLYALLHKLPFYIFSTLYITNDDISHMHGLTILNKTTYMTNEFIIKNFKHLKN